MAELILDGNGLHIRCITAKEIIIMWNARHKELVMENEDDPTLFDIIHPPVYPKTKIEGETVEL